MYWLLAWPALFSAPDALMVSGNVPGGVPGGTVIVIGTVSGLLAHRLTGGAAAVAPVGSPDTWKSIVRQKLLTLVSIGSKTTVEACVVGVAVRVP
jgi:hypothetical protein